MSNYESDPIPADNRQEYDAYLESLIAQPCTVSGPRCTAEARMCTACEALCGDAVAEGERAFNEGVSIVDGGIAYRASLPSDANPEVVNWWGMGWQRASLSSVLRIVELPQHAFTVYPAA